METIVTSQSTWIVKTISRVWEAMKIKEETLAQVFSCEFSKISKNTFFTEHLWTTTSSFSFSEAANGGVLWRKTVLKISQNSQENTGGLQNFQEHLY